MSKNGLTLKIFALILLNDIGDTVAQSLFKFGLAQTGISEVRLGNIAEFALRNASSYFVWLGIAVYALNFVIWMVILYRVDLSIAMPVGSFCYIFVPLSAIYFLHERISPLRWAGIALIILGIHFVTRSARPAARKALP